MMSGDVTFVFVPREAESVMGKLFCFKDRKKEIAIETLTLCKHLHEEHANTKLAKD